MPSSVVQRLSYDDRTRTLFVRFQSGQLYAYFEVPRTVYVDFARARSKGRYFARRVRDVFAFSRVEEPEGAGPATLH